MLKIYKETKVDIRPTSGSIINIPIQSPDNPPRNTKFSILTPAATQTEVLRDEDSFAKKYLATQGSVYFRQRKTYPRSFLWRVLGGNRYLEIRSADLTKSATENNEAIHTLRFEFQDPIIPHGVALADPEDHEVLNVFVITSNRQLHTFTLRPEFFRRIASIDENVADWCKVSCPAPLAFAQPHRLHASSPYELFISLDSGALLRLTRKAGDDGSHWSPITFDEKPWGASLRGLMKWGGQQAIRYDGRSLDSNTANAIAATSDQAFVFVVGLNHTLKAWNLASHRLVGSVDLLNRTEQHQSASLASLNPSESAFIRVFNAERAMEGELYYVVTYSPHDDGQFKFWAVKGGLTSQLVIEDLFPNTKLKPADPDPSGNVFWNVTDFQIKSMDEGRRMALWVLWRNNNLYQLLSLHFDLENLEDAWNNNWAATAFETRRDVPPPAFVPSDIADPTEKWLEYFFHPGRYSSEILTTSLAIYQDATKQKPLAKKQASLQQQLCATIPESVVLRKFNDAEIDYTRYRRETDAKWRQFWQIAEDLSKRRNEPISLAYDAYTDLPWLLLTDGCCLIRECSGTEILLHNDGTTLQEGRRALEDSWDHRNLGLELGNRADEVARLLDVAGSLQKSFTLELSHASRNALVPELFMESSLSAPERVATFHGLCKFSELITDDMFDTTFSNIESSIGFSKLTSDLFFSVLDTLPLRFPGKDSELFSTDFGRTALVAGTLETVELNKQVLYDLLLLTVFIETELTQEEGIKFDGVELFVTLVDLLKEYEMMSWLGSNVRHWPEKSLPSSMVNHSNSDVQEGPISTILEDLFAVHIKPRPTINIPQSFALTQQITDVISWITRQGEVSFPNVLVFIQCDLLACGNIDLASDFLRFQPNTAWSTYVKGRLYVARSEFDTAAVYFQKAAYILSHGKAVGNLHEMSSNLLDIISVNSFYDGLAKYFQHILTLFEQARAFAHVADFARLALQALESETRKNERDPDYLGLRTDLLSRLFHASLKTCRFDEAYSALSRYTDIALQKSALTSLITKVLSASGPGTAGLQKILRFPLSLSANLCSHVDDVLVSLTKKQTTFPSSLGASSTNAWQGKQGVPDYSRVLQAYRIARNDFRGAAETAYRTVQRLRSDRDTPSSRVVRFAEPQQAVDEDDLESQELRHELLALINLLACMEKTEAYILVEPLDSQQQQNAATRRDSVISVTGDEGSSSILLDSSVMMSKSPRSPPGSADSSANNSNINNVPSPTLGHSTGSLAGRRPSAASLPPNTSNPFAQMDNQQGKSAAAAAAAAKRVVVTLEDLRREYQAELDRVSRIQNGQWEFGNVGGGGGVGDDDDGEAMDTL
ncbi:hypothetical protein AJ80_06046 [Polytolypa hystricis UAMH7299]|uniref:Nucleoporin Nup120/160-domain-containing protein n=1 Tax=Polytolypa hystricis (strain UAMH7299) TaxID=1447883 RepID=A0A2B7Y0C7_POLH7|nr:hypothetical protein AJ80_06046 [Polytolypa hystricis UAMH7299]